ncbi:MAG: CHRD domain-containing protein [Verrucomicrobia bacterium]|nr:CHRD domain-containing protein [Verrucomicrobiota bacterium]
MNIISLCTRLQGRPRIKSATGGRNPFSHASALALGLTAALLLREAATAQTFTNVTDKGLAAAINWDGGNAPYLLQKKTSLTDSNWVNVLTTLSSNTAIAKDTQAGFFRLQNQVTNTVVAFTAYMDGASEVPAVVTPATAIGTLALEGSNLTYNVNFSGLSAPATAAHIHGLASPTNTAGVLIPLTVPAATEGTIAGTKLLTTDQIAAIVNGMTYLNIHNTNNPGGEIRGQIVPLHTTVTLNGASEVPPVTTSATGSGSLTFIGSQLLYDISYSGLAGPATAAHIHGPADTTQSTNVLVPLSTPSGPSGTISGSLSLTPTQLNHLLRGVTYINIHNTNYPGGEIRGQIYPFQLGVNMNGASEAPTPTVTPGTGSGLMNLVNSVLTYNISYTNLLSAATAFHIHGPADTTHAAGVLFALSGTSGTSGTLSGTQALTVQQLFYLVSGLTYANIHTTNYPGGEIRGQNLPLN